MRNIYYYYAKLNMHMTSIYYYYYCYYYCYYYYLLLLLLITSTDVPLTGSHNDQYEKHAKIIKQSNKTTYQQNQMS